MGTGYFSVERRRERLKDRLGEARDELAHHKLFQRNHGGHRAQIRNSQRAIDRAQRRLNRFNEKHPGDNQEAS